MCAYYKDCCKNSKYFVAEEQFWEPGTSTCTKLLRDDRHLQVKKSCHRDWDNDETRARCETESGRPLVSHRTKVTYSNVHCAICNNDFDASTDNPWPAAYACYDNDDRRLEFRITSRDNKIKIELSFSNIIPPESLKYSFPTEVFPFLHFYNGTLGSMLNLTALIQYKPHNTGDFNDNKRADQHREKNSRFSANSSNYKCDIRHFIPDKNIMRPCFKAISTCAPDWVDSDVEAKCLAYTDYYCHIQHYFRNPHCALCNHVDLFETQYCVLRDLLSDFSDLIKWDKSSDKESHPHMQDSNIIRKYSDGKLIFSLERL